MRTELGRRPPSLATQMRAAGQVRRGFTSYNSPGLAHRLLGPLRFALGDVHTYPVPSWADSL